GGVLTAAATTCAVTGATLLAVAFTPHAGPPPRPVNAERAPASETPAQPPQTPPRAGLPPSPPTRITVPGVGLEAAVDRVALEESGAIALPQDPDHAGWYTGSPTPGQNGNAILVGHVDSRDGPAAFYRLGAVKKGDHIEVNRQDGRTTTYEVDSISIWPQNDFPSQHVYGPTTGPRITLITCADWDDERKTYTSNLVVTARPTSRQPSA
ncbi:sortase domain-containing protein, partial [Streptomyces coelicoflavus]|uniref:sortase domain-containing protein n=1 Tax=Streptomyces coelicoflavus TaxID=285562 RepID=UPI00362E0C6E